ncbi:unnamed protein product [Caenorhabditis sp. 36 PRJEB53466]|nr:unnamed protein product [Caenorhabditis sp. 36 PRJEB53466]
MRRYPEETIAILIKWFELGKGKLSYAAKTDIYRRTHLTSRQIHQWFQDRLRRCGIYNELRFIKRLKRHMALHPNESPTDEMYAELEEIMNRIIRMNGWEAAAHQIPQLAVDRNNNNAN